MASAIDTNTQLLNRAARTNTLLFGIVCAVCCGAVFLLANLILLWQGGEGVGGHLSLLSIFIPGYSMTGAGIFVGVIWVSLYAFVSGWVVYRAYVKSLGLRLLKQGIDTSPGSDQALIAPVATLSGNALGIGLGLLIAIQLLVTTNILVLRGTADDSVHAALLGHFLPGYSVSTVGSFIGAIECFIFIYAASHLLALIYNRLVVRHS